MAKIYGHSQMIALRGDDGLLCYRWIASPEVSMLLFVEPKSAKEWLKAAGQCVELPHLNPVPVSAVPEGLRVVINPSHDVADIRRMMASKEFRA